MMEMIEQISHFRPAIIPAVADARIQVEAIRNPILREMAGAYNESGGRFFSTGVSAYSKGSHTKSSYSKGGSGGGCYLTTACTNARGLPDNCLELVTLRAFRDKILMPSREGREVVRKYYQEAPKIVEAVNASGNSQGIWDEVYSDIQRTVDFVSCGEFNEAFRKYRRMTIALKEKYLN